MRYFARHYLLRIYRAIGKTDFPPKAHTHIRIMFYKCTVFTTSGSPWVKAFLEKMENSPSWLRPCLCMQFPHSVLSTTNGGRCRLRTAIIETAKG